MGDSVLQGEVFYQVLENLIFVNHLVGNCSLPHTRRLPRVRRYH